jgi:hypothetical protein
VLRKFTLPPRYIQYLMIGLAVTGLIMSLLAPGWGLAPIFAAVIVYLWKFAPLSARVGEGSGLRGNSSPLTHKRRSEPDTYRSIEWKGMIFRSESEIKIAKTLDHRGIFFIPPTRVRLNAGKQDRQSRELDFVICHEKKWGVLEVDGPYHVREADAERDGWLRAHGIRNIQRFSATRCYHEPQKVVDEFLHHLENMP